MTRHPPIRQTAGNCIDKRHTRPRHSTPGAPVAPRRQEPHPFSPLDKARATAYPCGMSKSNPDPIVTARLRRCNDLTPLGKHLAMKLLELGWTWNDLAMELGVSRQRVSQIARAKRPLLSTLTRLADAIGEEPERLYKFMRGGSR